MISFFNPEHALHAPAHEFFRGQLVPCFEKPERADFIAQALRARGHEIRQASLNSRAVLARVHTPRYLQFFETAWAQWLALGACRT